MTCVALDRGPVVGGAMVVVETLTARVVPRIGLMADRSGGRGDCTDLANEILHLTCRYVLDVQNLVDVCESVFWAPSIDGMTDFKDGMFREDVLYCTDLTFACGMSIGEKRVDR